jgi:NADP-dependent 3-hydroxy acid dehydrogenase YdfG
MSGTIAILGAGSGLGLATAQRFARAGFQVAMVGRRQARLDALAAEVDGATRTFATDVTDHDRLAKTLAEIGDVDVMMFGATGMDEPLSTPLELHAQALRFQLELRLVAPVVATQLVLPGMLARGAGTLLYATGTSAIEPMAMLGNVSIAATGLRTYVRLVHAEASPHGVHAGLLAVGGLVEGSEARERFTGLDVPTLRPSDLAEVLWDMHVRRGQVERVVTP